MTMKYLPFACLLGLASCQSKTYKSYTEFSEYKTEEGGYWVYLGKKGEKHHFRRYLAPWVRDDFTQDVYVTTEDLELDEDGKKLLSVAGEIPVSMLKQNKGLTTYEGPVKTTFVPESKTSD